ncbi:MAG TPA: thymidine phosphorylase, partial [Polyangiaceae bacterium]
ERALADGSALECFMRMVKAHGGDTRVLEQPQRLASAKARFEVLARSSGYVSECDAYALGMSGIALGAGRTRADQAVDPNAGIELCALRGERVTRGQPLAVIHARTKSLAMSEAERVEQAFQIGRSKPRARHVVLERITR